jgi:hypothetical protein
MNSKGSEHFDSLDSNKRACKGKAKIAANGGYLRIQLPRELFEGKQKYLALGLSDTPENRHKAQLKLAIVQRDIDYKEFDITLKKYKRKILDLPIDEKENHLTPTVTVREYFKIYEEEYFATRRRKQTKRQQITLFKTHEEQVKKYLSFDSVLTENLITEAFKSTPPNSAVRVNLWKSLVSFCKIIGFQYNKFDKFKCTYEHKSRYLPDDQAITDGWVKMKLSPLNRNFKIPTNADCYNWAYGVLATYGLRAHEILAIDYQKSFKPPRYALYIDAAITDGTKTGSRIAYPLPPEWVEFFDLANVKNSMFMGKMNRDNRLVRELSNYLGERFKTREVGFQPYDLRHRYAIRGHELGVPIDDMARWMGHSVETHTQTYQKWMKEETSHIVFDSMVERLKHNKRKIAGIPTYEELYLELERYKLRIIELESE